MRLGEWRWLKLFDRSIGWASVLPTDDWKRPDRIMGPWFLDQAKKQKARAMTRVAVSVEEIEMEGDRGLVPGVAVCCEHCGEVVKVFGTSDASIKRGCIMLRDQCDGRNFYYYEDDE